MSQRWVNVWDDKKNISGSVYLTPTYSGGLENGLAVYTAPGTAHFTADVGAPARHMNYVLFQQGDDRVKADQHLAMRFNSGRDWPSATASLFPVCGGSLARSDRGFIAGIGNSGATLAIYSIREPKSTGALTIYTAVTTQPLVLWDDAAGHVTMFPKSGQNAAIITSTTATTTAWADTPFAVGQVGNNNLIVGLSGTSTTMRAWTWVSNSTITTATTVTVPAGTYASSTASLWQATQVFLGSNTSTGKILYYSKGATSNNYLISSSATDLTKGTLPVTEDKLADIAYDDIQGVYVMASYSSTGSAVKFHSSADGATWVASATATGPANFAIPSGAADGSVAFGICSGIWFIASTSARFTNSVYGQSADVGKRVAGVYSLDYGVTWYPANIDMAVASSGATLRVISSVDQFLVKLDTDIAMSGRLGYNETV